MTTPAAAQAPADPAKPETTPAPAPTAPAATPEPVKPQDPAKRSVLAEKPQEPEPGKKPDAAAPEGKPNDGTPDAYEVKVPEGVKVDEAELKQWTGTAKELGLTPEQASKLISLNDQRSKAAVDAQAQAWAKQGDDWYGALEKDPEFGGANQKASEAALQTALKRFDPKGELAADLERYGIENLPSLAKLLRRIGLAGAEDKVVVPRAPEKQPTGEDTRLAKKYPSIKGIQPGSRSGG
jgi:hypothetical protein